MLHLARRRLATNAERQAECLLISDLVSNHGHESERVQVRLRDDGGSLVNVQDTAVSQMSGLRARPGADPRWRWGSGEMPGLQATAVGELQGQDNERGSPLTGSFSLALRCAED